MKIYLPNSESPSTGKGYFLQRLTKELKTQRIDITNAEQYHDIALHFTKIKEKTKAKYIIVRYNGVYHNTAQNYKAMNTTISNSIKHANGIIYQSQFGKQMCDKYIGKFNGPTKIILNGADPKYYEEIKPINSKYKHNFIAASRWRPHKRLRDILESFILADINNSHLWVAGEINESGLSSKEIKKYNKDKITFLGQISQEEMSKYLVLCKCAIHLCWLDCCPNSVIEAIAAGCIIISNNVGGTPELTGPSNGIICNIDKPYNLQPIDLYNPPQIDRQIIANAITKTINNPRIINKEPTDIKNITKQYINFFKEVINA